jgi:hypothetical protein
MHHGTLKTNLAAHAKKANTPMQEKKPLYTAEQPESKSHPVTLQELYKK